MVRGGALTLGAVLMLGVASGARAQDLSAFGAAAQPSLVGVLPNRPQNWSDLPLLLSVSESAGYNSNILNTPSHSLISTLAPVAAFESISNYGASTKWYIGGQQFFADGSFGLNRYLDKTYLNQSHNAVDLGVNWTYTSKCAGMLKAAEQTSPSEPGQQVGVNVINSVTAQSFNETAKCSVTGNYAAILNSGTTTSTNSGTADKVNNFQNEFVAAGMSYNVTETNSLQLLATVTGTDYTDRSGLTTTRGLVNKITEDQINLSYVKDINPNLSLVASVGVEGTRDVGFSLTYPTGFEPQYSLAITWAMTPKLSLTASVARIATPPTAIIANLQITESANLGLTYQLTPKISLSGSVNTSRVTGAFTQSGLTGAVLATGQNEHTYGARANLTYAMTPFLGASLSYQYSRTVQAGLVTPTSVTLLTLNFAPH